MLPGAVIKCEMFCKTEFILLSKSLTVLQQGLELFWKSKYLCGFEGFKSLPLLRFLRKFAIRPKVHFFAKIPKMAWPRGFRAFWFKTLKYTCQVFFCNNLILISKKLKFEWEDSNLFQCLCGFEGFKSLKITCQISGYWKAQFLWFLAWICKKVSVYAGLKGSSPTPTAFWAFGWFKEFESIFVIFCSILAKKIFRRWFGGTVKKVL